MRSARRRALVFGEALIDEAPSGSAVAGAPLHVAMHLAARGWDVAFVTRVGRDDAGRQIVAALTQRGVHDTFVELDDHLPTGRALVSHTPSGPRFSIPSPAAWDQIAGPQSPPECRLFYCATLAGRSGASRATLLRLLDATTAPVRAADVNLRAPHVNRNLLARVVARATVLKMSEEEEGVVAAELGFDAAPAAYFHRAAGLEWLCVTHGARGAELHARDGSIVRAGPPKVDVIDTVGAGDAFCAGLLDALAGDAGPDEALAAASKTAQDTLGHPGGLPPVTR